MSLPKTFQSPCLAQQNGSLAFRVLLTGRVGCRKGKRAIMMPSIRSLLEQACEQGEIRWLDLHLGLFLEKQARKAAYGKNQKHLELLLAATLASAAVGSGHVCWPLAQNATLPTALPPSLLPVPSRWRNSLLASGVVGQPGEIAPLILDQQNRLYLYRFHSCEELLAADLRHRAREISTVEPQIALPFLARLFPRNTDSSEPDLQQTAATLALLKPLLVISGGPGTGKTYTAARILALLQALHCGDK
ncbi:hypothetical protein VU06_04745, partial [Desulfobulbus sp. F3]|nr:hypothetical protein [Desulfobulbus sp. F3]